MTIDGRLRIWNDSVCHPKNGGTCEASNGDDTSALALTFDRDTYWSSIDSAHDDSETFTVNFAEQRRIDSIWLIGHNFKNFTITYGSTPTQFVLRDALAESGTYSSTGIGVTGCSLNTSFFEVTEVLTDRINITITDVQTSDEQKKLTTFAAALLMGEFSDPTKAMVASSVVLQPNNREIVNIANKTSMIRGIDSLSASVAIQPSDNQNDQWLVEWLFANSDPLIFWPCGGLHGSDTFAVEARGYNLDDIYRVYVNSAYAPQWTDDIYSGGTANVIDFVEAV